MDTLLELLEDAKDLVWNDDDEYVIGYNHGIERAISIIYDYFAPIKPKPYQRGGWLCGHCNKVTEVGGANYCWNCGRRIQWTTEHAEPADTISAEETGTSAAT